MNEEGRQRHLTTPTITEPPAPPVSTSTENVAFVAKANRAPAKPGFKSKIKCHKCGGIGHFRSDCPTSDADAAAFAAVDDEDFAVTAIGDEDIVYEW